MSYIRLAFVVAVAENGVIGKDGMLPWSISSDLKRFRSITFGKPVIMGRKTFESINRTLDGRSNIIVTRKANFKIQGAHVVNTIKSAITNATFIAKRDGVSEIMVIGGSQIYNSLLENADRIYLTRVHSKPKGDAFFPNLSSELWLQTAYEELPYAIKDDCRATFYVLDRRIH
ncbi:MAG: IS1595 family transposase ISSsu9 [Hyphomicrobiaceae bacterium hypho_1]